MERTVADARVVAANGTARRGLQASEHRMLLVCGDLLAASAAVAVSIWIWSITAGFPFTISFVAGRAEWFLAVPAWVLVLLPSHSIRTALSARATAAALLRAMAALLVVYLGVYFYVPPRELPRLVALYILWEGALLLLAWRLWYLWFFSRAPYLRRVLVVGSGERAETAVRLIRDTPPVTRIVAAVVELPPKGGSHERFELAARVGDARAVEVVLATPGQPDDALIDALLQCQERGVAIVSFPQLYEQTLQRVPVRHVDREWLLTSFAEAIGTRDASGIIKRALDLAGAVAGLVALLALAPFIAAAIRLEGPGPIFFRQTRVGRGGSLFRIVKFRTMDGPDDPRVTRVGRLLRRIRLDELPNVLNILRGEMSLVGPRPERPELVAILERQLPFYRTRLIARPGLTGWAQVNRPYTDPVAGAAEKLEYDLYYLKHRSFAFDLWILLRTVGTVVGLKGR